MAAKYDRKFMRSFAGTALYNKWDYAKKGGLCEEWEDFNAFCLWALNNGFECGKTLTRKDASKPYAPDNCLWCDEYCSNKGVDKTEWVKKWNKTVNRIRVAYGMEPFEV